MRVPTLTRSYERLKSCCCQQAGGGGLIELSFWIWDQSTITVYLTEWNIFLNGITEYGTSSLFRWFKFTLKPPYTITHGNLLSAIWDTSHWTSFVKFGLKTAWDISYDILWPILKYINFWRLQGHSSNLSKKMPSENRFFLNEGATRLWWG